MKINFSILLFFLTYHIQAQLSIDQKFYFNEKWEKCEPKEAAYYRVVGEFNTQLNAYYAKDFLVSGKLFSEGTYFAPDIGSKHGKVIYYYKNALKKKEVEFYFNKKVGTYKEWYNNGNQKLEAVYQRDKLDMKAKSIYKINSYWNLEGTQLVKKGKGEYSNCENDELICEKGLILQGLKHNEWSGFDKKLKLEFKEYYKKGSLKKGESSDSIGNIYSYSQLETFPKPEGGITNYYSYIERKIATSKSLKKSDFKGKILVNFTVDENGIIEDCEFIASPNFKNDDEVIQILKNGPKWLPGTKRGRKMKMNVIQPLTFH